MAQLRKRAPRELFLSHATQDAKVAQELAAVLNDHGIRTWYSGERLIPADRWHDEIGTALRRCDWFLLLLSPSAVEAMWVKRELMYALRDKRYEDHILPVMYRHCEPAALSWVLEDFQMLKLGRNRAESYRQLLRTWGMEYSAKPTQKPIKQGAPRKAAARKGAGTAAKRPAGKNAAKRPARKAAPARKRGGR